MIRDARPSGSRCVHGEARPGWCRGVSVHAGGSECGVLLERLGSKSFAAALDAVAELKRVLPHIDCRSDAYTVAATIEVRNLAGDLRGRGVHKTKKACHLNRFKDKINKDFLEVSTSDVKDFILFLRAKNLEDFSKLRDLKDNF